MTDKQIIIDGVDVSGCEHYNDLNCFAYRDSCGYPLDCEDIKNCYYKRLKRKEQECEELRTERKNLKRNLEGNIQVKNHAMEEIKQLKAENERLQEEREKAKNYNLEYGQLLIKATNKNNKLKQTLAEIKEIAEDESYVGFWDEQITKILQKINEVQNVENG